MNRYDSQEADRLTRQAERDARRNARARRKPSRSVGADVITVSGARSLGLAHPSSDRPRGRGETARRAEQDRWDGKDEDCVSEVNARPAVFTDSAPRKRFSLKAPSLPAVPIGVVIAVLIVVALVIVWGPARMYYAAWRDAGVLQVRYEVAATQNAELTHELDRLQSLDGIEDEARRRGYAYPDEEAIVMDGAEELRVADPNVMNDRLAEYEAGLPWYIHALDVILGYTSE